MTMMNASQLRQVLIGEKLLPSTASMPPLDTQERPWFVSALLGFCGWLAGLFVVLLVGTNFQPHGAGQWFVAAALSLGAAFFYT